MTIEFIPESKEGSESENQLKLLPARDQYGSQVLPKTHTFMKKKKWKNEQHEADLHSGR